MAKLYECTRDLTHYRYKGAIYNFQKGMILPETVLILQHPEYFQVSNVYTPEKKQVFHQMDKPDVFLNLQGKKVSLTKIDVNEHGKSTK